MESKDCRGLAVSSRNPAALQRYESAMELTASYFVDPLAAVTAAIEQEPSCAIAHCLRAALGVMSTERGALPMIQESVEAGAALARARTIASAATSLRHAPGSMAILPVRSSATATSSSNYPRDRFALQVAHIGDFLLGHSTMLRDRVAQVLPHWNEDVPGYGYVLGMHAFGLEETALLTGRKIPGAAPWSSIAATPGPFTPWPT